MINIAAISLTLMVLPQVGMATPCDELDAVNEGWRSVLSMANEYNPGVPLDHEERRQLSAAIADQFDNSEALPWSFEDVGDERGAALASALVKQVKDLYRPLGEFHENDAALANSLAAIAAALDAIGDHCANR